MESSPRSKGKLPFSHSDRDSTKLTKIAYVDICKASIKVAKVLRQAVSPLSPIEKYTCLL